MAAVSEPNNLNKNSFDWNRACAIAGTTLLVIIALAFVAFVILGAINAFGKTQYGDKTIQMIALVSFGSVVTIVVFGGIGFLCSKGN